MNPNPTADELNDAVQNAQSQTDGELKEAGYTYSEAMDIVESVDRRDGVALAFLSGAEVTIRKENGKTETVAISEVDENDANDNDVSPVSVRLHKEKPEGHNGLPGDSMWIRVNCDRCGRKGWVVEEAADYGLSGENAPGLVCESCS